MMISGHAAIKFQTSVEIWRVIPVLKGREISKVEGHKVRSHVFVGTFVWCRNPDLFRFDFGDRGGTTWPRGPSAASSLQDRVVRPPTSHKFRKISQTRCRT
jgi:hypothetical protein